MLMVCKWRHTKMLKRAGRAFDPGGLPATAPGSLAIPCRACPMPNINLPRGWENMPAEKAYIFKYFNTVRLRKLKTDISKWLCEYFYSMHTFGPFVLKSSAK